MKSIKRLLSVSESGIFLTVVLISLIVGLINPVFFSFDNIMNVLHNTSFTLIVAIGMTFVLVSAGLDLSVGSFLALGSLFTGICLREGVPIPLALLIGIGVGAVGGWINGFIVVKFKIPPLITTLGTMYMGRGLVLIITKGTPVYPLPEAFGKIDQGVAFGINYSVFIALILAVIGHFVLTRTVFGRSVYAVGGNEETARLSGINVNRVKLVVYIIVGALSAVTGILTTSRLGSAQPNIGVSFEMEVISAVIIGGTSLFGGAGTILGTVLGALFMNILANGMTLVHVSAYWQQFTVGLVIILAVGLDLYKRRKQGA
ncbi:ABC transporter permease [Cohnella soli]|uniref:ABC transporter permease n=1 Tax=Cohnella soli TaxID=425005 RepID=A0ABW0HWA6_9BACL